MGNIIDTDQKLIEGVFYEPLRQIGDDRGAVYHHLNYKSPTFKGFEEVYISKTYPGKIKAWKKHLRMTQNFCVPVGEFKFVLFDDRTASSTQGIINEFVINEDKAYKLLSIPPNIWYGFQCLSSCTGIIVNLSNLLYDPEEIIKIDELNDLVPYNNWDDTGR